MAKKNRPQNWRILLTYDERIRLHQILRLVVPKGTDGVKRNGQAIAAVEAGEGFTVPIGADEDAARKLNDELNEKRKGNEAKLIHFHVTNADEILTSIDTFTKNPPQIAQGVPALEAYGGNTRYLIDAIGRFEAAKDNREIPGEAEPFEPEPEPAKEPAAEGDEASGNGQDAKVASA